MKIGRVGAELFPEERRTDGRTDMTTLAVVVHSLPTPLKILPSALTVHCCVVRGYRK